METRWEKYCGFNWNGSNEFGNKETTIKCVLQEKR